MSSQYGREGGDVRERGAAHGAGAKRGAPARVAEDAAAPAPVHHAAVQRGGARADDLDARVARALDARRLRRGRGLCLTFEKTEDFSASKVDSPQKVKPSCAWTEQEAGAGDGRAPPSNLQRRRARRVHVHATATAACNVSS